MMKKTVRLGAIAPVLLRQAVAHVVAITFVGYAISAGIVILANGMTSIFTAFEIPSVYLLALLFFSVISLPVGLFLRFLCGKVPVRPLVGLVLMGIIFGLGLIPIMHPEMTDERIAIEMYRGELFLIHGIAGSLGGGLWWLIEFRILGRRAP